MYNTPAVDFEGNIYVWQKRYAFQTWFSQSSIERGNKIEQTLLECFPFIKWMKR